MAQRIVNYSEKIGAINSSQEGSTAGRSVQDALMRFRTLAQEWLNIPITTSSCLPPRSTILGSDIDGAFNTVRYNRQIDVLSGIDFPRYAVRWTENFCTERKHSFHFDSKSDNPHPFDLGLPQGSPQSPILFVIHSAATITAQPLPPRFQAFGGVARHKIPVSISHVSRPSSVHLPR